MSPERFGINDPGFGETNLYFKVQHRGGERFRAPRILAGLRDTGEAEAIMPVLKELSARGADVFIMAREKGEKELNSLGTGFELSRHFDPGLRIERMVGAVITGFSGGPSVEMALNLASRERGRQVFAIEDYPGSYFHDLKEIFGRVPEAVPTYLFVGSDWAKGVNLEVRPDFPEKNILVTGSPALDKIAEIDQVKVRREVRTKLGVSEDEILIGWFGQLGEATIESLGVFLNGLNDLTLTHSLNYRLAKRLHPRDDKPESLEIYGGFFAPFGSKVVDAGRTVITDAVDVIAALDLLVQERSSTANQAVALGVPVVSVVIPEINDKYGVMPGLRVPVLEEGASLLVSRPEEMSVVLEQVLFDQHIRGVLYDRMRPWVPDGLAAVRVADFIMEKVGVVMDG